MFRVRVCYAGELFCFFGLIRSYYRLCLVTCHIIIYLVIILVCGMEYDCFEHVSFRGNGIQNFPSSISQGEVGINDDPFKANQIIKQNIQYLVREGGNVCIKRRYYFMEIATYIPSVPLSRDVRNQELHWNTASKIPELLI